MRKMLESFVEVRSSAFILVSEVIKKCVFFMETMMTFDLIILVPNNTQNAYEIPCSNMLVYQIFLVLYSLKSMLFKAHIHIKKFVIVAFES